MNIVSYSERKLTLEMTFRVKTVEAPHKISTRLAKQFQRRRSLKLWTTDGRTPDHGHPISSPCEPSAQVS